MKIVRKISLRYLFFWSFFRRETVIETLNYKYDYNHYYYQFSFKYFINKFSAFGSCSFNNLYIFPVCNKTGKNVPCLPHNFLLAMFSVTKLIQTENLLGYLQNLRLGKSTTAEKIIIDFLYFRLCSSRLDKTGSVSVIPLIKNNCKISLWHLKM